jgi:purine-nucleoside phosphorylase
MDTATARLDRAGPPAAVRRPCRPRADAEAAAARIIAAGGRGGTVAVVLGTGLGDLATRLGDAWSIPGADTRWLMPSTATGHAGNIVGGTLRGVEIVMLQGRVHGYEGFPPETLTRGVELLTALGVRMLLVTNAAGGLRPDMRTGELVVVTDHIDLVRKHWAAGIAPTAAGESRRRSGWYDPALVDLAIEAARRSGAVCRRGVYAYLSGPSYETRAEYRMLRRYAADVVGMSTVPEVVAAGLLGLKVAACSVVTNVARPDAATQTDAEDVCRAAADAAEGVWAVISAFADHAAGRTPCGSC